jgi:exodeoxyribonuclease-3
MSKLKLVSWNVNGIRSVAGKGFFDWLNKDGGDIVCLQETKIDASALNDTLRKAKGYTSYWSHAQKKGYSGVAIYTKEAPLLVTEGLGVSHLDTEGRMLTAEYADFILMNIYFPNGAQSQERLDFKMEFYEAFLKHINKLRTKGKRIIFCGDVNTAHKEIDLARPKANEKISGFLPQERAWMDKLVNHGYIDTFRAVNQEPHNYSWWHMRSAARERNVGWRIDYFFLAPELEKNLHNATIESHVMGSDHCPVTLELKI